MKAQDANKQILNNKVQEIINKVIAKDGCAYIENERGIFGSLPDYPSRLIEYLEDQEVVQALEKLDYKITKMSKEVIKYKYKDVKFLGIFKKSVYVEYTVPETWFVVET